MLQTNPLPEPKSRTPERAGRYEPPACEVIPLDCEITAYAPDGDTPLF